MKNSSLLLITKLLTNRLSNSNKLMLELNLIYYLTSTDFNIASKIGKGESRSFMRSANRIVKAILRAQPTKNNWQSLSLTSLRQSYSNTNLKGKC